MRVNLGNGGFLYGEDFHEGGESNVEKLVFRLYLVQVMLQALYV